MASGSRAISLLLADYPKMVDKLAVAAMPTVDGDPERATSSRWLDDRSRCEVEARQGGGIGHQLDAGGGHLRPEGVLHRDQVHQALTADLAGGRARPGSRPHREPLLRRALESTKTAILEPTYDWQVSLAMGTALEKAMRGGDIEAAQKEASATITKVIGDLRAWPTSRSSSGTGTGACSD